MEDSHVGRLGGGAFDKYIDATYGDIDAARRGNSTVRDIVGANWEGGAGTADDAMATKMATKLRQFFPELVGADAAALPPATGTPRRASC